MGKLIIKLALLFSLVVGTGLAIILIQPTDPNHYMRAVKDKHQRLEEIESPKLVILGGSNTAFGINSQAIADSLNMPVINMGIHVGLGWEFILAEAADHIHEDDIIIISPEYSHLFWGTQSGFNPAFYKTVELYPEAVTFLPTKSVPRSLALSYVELLQSKIKALIFRNNELESPHIAKNKHIYLRDSYDANGDMIAHLGSASQDYNQDDDRFTDFKDQKILPEFIKLTNQFTEVMEGKGAKIFLSYAPTPISVYDHETGKRIHSELTESMKLVILGTPEAMVYPDNQFFDTRYHLIDSSRMKRTEYIIDELKSQSDL